MANRPNANAQTALRLLRKIAPHAVIVMAGMMLVFFCIDQVNEHMGFMTNEFHRWLSMLLAVASLCYSMDAIARARRAERAAEEKRRRAQQAKSRAAGGAPAKTGTRPASQRPAVQQPRPAAVKKA